MTPPTFLTARHSERGVLWAAVDPNVRFLVPEIAERRFGAHLRPYPNEHDARAALIAAGAAPDRIELELGRGNRGRR